MPPKNYLLILLTLLAISCTNSKAPVANKTEEVSYTIETRDIANFWIAYDSLATSEDSIRIFQRLYLDKASPYFKEFLLKSGYAEKYSS